MNNLGSTELYTQGRSNTTFLNQRTVEVGAIVKEGRCYSAVYVQHGRACLTWMPACSSPCATAAVRSAAARWRASSHWSPCSICEARCRSAAACVDWGSGLPRRCGETSSACTFLHDDERAEALEDAHMHFNVSAGMTHTSMHDSYCSFLYWFCIISRIKSICCMLNNRSLNFKWIIQHLLAPLSQKRIFFHFSLNVF